MPKKLALLFCWFSATLILLLFTSFYFYSNSHPITFSSVPGTKIAEQLETRNVEGQVLGIQIYDKRPFAVSTFLHKTILEQYSTYIVEVSDKYSIDYRLIAAIAMKESGGGNKAPSDSYNAWGFENGRTHWGSWEEAIDKVGKTLKTKYIDKGLNTPDLIMPVYAPPAVENGGGWAIAINDYLNKMESIYKSL
ncbi:glucosaminidase domain-containing protein [Candidatus Curtissbacteria bacterium]|nr:glucosaminidase domain-containing protein [Candidatus Curtissbacteria bacterium]